MLDIIVDIIYSFLLIWAGYLMLRYRKQVKSWTGNFVWAEHYIGRGGTYFILILIALGLIFYGVIYPFGGMSLLTGWQTIQDISTPSP